MYVTVIRELNKEDLTIKTYVQGFIPHTLKAHVAHFCKLDASYEFSANGGMEEAWIVDLNQSDKSTVIYKIHNKNSWSRISNSDGKEIRRAVLNHQRMYSL